jgi:1,2-diacylglycerol 3-alpha-glucosyltransferase
MGPIRIQKNLKDKINMRVLITGSTYSPALNGQAVFTTNLAEGLARRGHEVLVVFPADPKTSSPPEQNGVRLKPLNSISLEFIHKDAYAPIRFKQRIAQVLDDFQPDLIHIQDHYPLSLWVIRSAQERGIKVIGTNHFMPENLAAYIPVLPKIKSLYDWLSWRWVLEVYNHVDVVTAQSQAAMKILRAQGLQRPIHAISCGVDLKHFHPNPNTDRSACRIRYKLDPTKTTLLFVGRVDREKHIDTLIQAFHLLPRQDGSALDELRNLAEQLNQSKRVHFLGPVSAKDLPVLLNSIDIFAMPSTAELLSIATLEAMACGRPVLLANAGALSGLVKHNVNGFLFKPGDAADAAQYIELLTDQRHRWKEMGKASRIISQSHSLEETISQYEILYEGLLGNTPLIDPDSLSKVKDLFPIQKNRKIVSADLPDF